MSHAVPRVVERGIYSPPWLDANGHRMLYAVNSAGRAVWSIRVFRQEEMHLIAEMLKGILDEYDPPRAMLA